MIVTIILLNTNHDEGLLLMPKSLAGAFLKTFPTIEDPLSFKHGLSRSNPFGVLIYLREILQSF